MSTKLRIALQKSGKLSDGSIELLNKCGFNIKPAKNHYLLSSNELNTNFLMVRDDDIPGFISSYVADVGIIGENLYVEYTKANPKHNLKIIERLNFATCRLSIATRSKDNIRSIHELQGKRIATSYPSILADHLAKNNVKCDIVVMHGSVELAPKVDIADAICDIVSTGVTLKENDLIEMDVVLTSEALLVGRTDIDNITSNRVDELVFRLKSVINVNNSKYIMLHIPKVNLGQLKDLLPGSESPTVLELQANPDKVAVHVVSQEQYLWNTIGKLKSIGASSILVMNIDKIVE